MAVSLVWFAAPTFALTCGGGSHDITLSSGGVSPGAGTTATDFTFTVTFTDSQDRAPSWVRLRYNGTSYPMTGSGSGTVYSLTTTMPLGTTAYSFRARSSTGGIVCRDAEPGSVTVTVVPTPTPVPTPKPTPKATAAPTPKATVKPTARPTAKPTVRPVAKATAKPTAKPVKVAAVTATDRPAATPRAANVSQAPTASDQPIAAVIGGTNDGRGNDGGSGGVGGSRATPGLDGGGSPAPALALMATTLGGLFLLFVFMRRRRTDGSAEGDLAFASIAGSASVASDVVAPARPSPQPARPAAPGPRPTPAISPLLAAKSKPDTKKDAARKAPGTKSATKGNERFHIGYRGVRLGDGPDDLRSTELGRLDRGDEVEILASHEGFLQVRTPAGLTGWIPRHTITGSPTAST